MIYVLCCAITGIFLSSFCQISYTFDQREILLSHTVKRYIIGNDLFGEIGELIHFSKISSHQMNKYGPHQ